MLISFLNRYIQQLFGVLAGIMQLQQLIMLIVQFGMREILILKCSLELMALSGIL